MKWTITKVSYKVHLGTSVGKLKENIFPIDFHSKQIDRIGSIAKVKHLNASYFAIAQPILPIFGLLDSSYWALLIYSKRYNWSLTAFSLYGIEVLEVIPRSFKVKSEELKI